MKVEEDGHSNKYSKDRSPSNTKQEYFQRKDSSRSTKDHKDSGRDSVRDLERETRKDRNDSHYREMRNDYDRDSSSSNHKKREEK